MKATDVNLLRRSSLFQFLPDEHFEKLRPLLQEESYEFGDVLVRQGDPADAFYVLVSGRARVVKADQNGKEIALATMKPGDSFGEAALSKAGTRTATVRCSTAVEALRLNRVDFLQLAEKTPDLKHYIEITRRHRALHGFLYEFSNFGRLPVPALRSLVEKLTPVEVPERRAPSSGKAIRPARCSFSRKGGRVLFNPIMAREQNLAFYRDGDFFGELSILNGSPRAASVEAASDCRLLALEPDAVRDLERRFPEFGKLVEERLAQYQAKTEARVPLDFATEMLPAEVAAHDKLGVDKTAPPREDTEPPFADESGLFRKGKKRIRKIAHIQQIDEMDCGAASLGMICRHFGRKVSLAQDSAALSHLDRWDELESDLPRGHGTWTRRARAESVTAQPVFNAVARDRALGRQPLDGALRRRRYLRAGGRSRARAAQDSAQGI